MTWRWDKPEDHEVESEKQHSNRYERELNIILERAGNDEAVDFDRLSAKVTSLVDLEKTKVVERTAALKTRAVTQDTPIRSR